MKQLLFLLLFPCLAMAQYQGNGNQKITLGEQTTADGLVYRGLAADTTRKPSVDTMAYILLDTNTNIIWQYKKATNNAWTRVGGSISSGLTGVLPVANGGTGSATQNFVDLTTTQSVGGAKTFTNAVTAGVASATSPQLIVLGGSQGTNMFELRRTSGAIATYAFSIAGSYLNFKDVTNNTTLLTLGYVSPNPDIVLGLDETSGSGNNGTTSILRASNSGTLTDLGGGALILRTGRGTGAGTLSDIYFNTADILSSGTSRQPTTTKMTIKGNGNVGIGQTIPTAVLHLKAGTATAAPIRLTSSGATLLSSLESGAVEFNGTNLLFTPSTTRHTVNHGLTGSATLDFLSTNAQNSRDMTIAVTGAADGDVVSLGVPNAAVNANTSYSAWVSAANTVTVRFNNYSSGTVDPASALFKVFVTK